MGTILYLVIGGIALFYLFGMGGLQQIQGMISGIGSGGGITAGGDGGISVGAGTGINVAGIHVGTDGIRVPGLANISADGGGGLTNVNNNQSILRQVSTGPGTHTQRVVQVNGKTLVNESNRARMSI